MNERSRYGGSFGALLVNLLKPFCAENGAVVPGGRSSAGSVGRWRGFISKTANAAPNRTPSERSERGSVRLASPWRRGPLWAGRRGAARGRRAAAEEGLNRPMGEARAVAARRPRKCCCISCPWCGPYGCGTPRRIAAAGEDHLRRPRLWNALGTSR